MANLYYLMSSLPSILVTDETPRITYEDLLSQSQHAIDTHNYKRLIEFNFHKIPNCVNTLHETEKKFWTWEISLRNELTYLRAKKFGIQPEEHVNFNVRTIGGDIKQIALSAFEEPDPMKVELDLDRARWNLLELNRSTDYFSMNSLLIYSMQLQLITRRSLFNKTTGEINYQREYDLILKEAKTVLMENIK